MSGCDGSPSCSGPQPSVLTQTSPVGPPVLTHLRSQGAKSVGEVGGLGQGVEAGAGVGAGVGAGEEAEAGAGPVGVAGAEGVAGAGEAA